MIDGYVVVDAHVHAPVLSTLKQGWLEWADTYSGEHDWRQAYRGDRPDPAALARMLADEGVDHAMLFCEYSPAVTGIQSIDEVAAIAVYDPHRFSAVANINPHLHFPPVDEFERQLALGAVALKLHPVHGRFDPGGAALYPLYARCADLGVPVIVHTGISSFPGSQTSAGNPDLLLDAIDYFATLPFIFAHGGRGWWYDTAAFLAQSKPNVWLDLAGLPPKKLPDYYHRFSLPRLATKMIFGTDWPGVPGARRNVEALINLGWPDEIVAAVLSENSRKLFSRMRFTPKSMT
jgi:uncharacterized protein